MGQWELLHYSTKDFCTSVDDLCPGTIKNGQFFDTCHRFEGERCYYKCDEGHKDNFRKMLTCHNKTWDIDTDLLCTDRVQCYHTIPHGSVSMTHCYAGQNCSYSCDNDLEYAKNEKITSVVCSDVTNRWLPSVPPSAYTSENDLCIARRCSTDIRNGHLFASCSAEVGTVCRYKCDMGYIGNVSKISCLSQRRNIDHYPSYEVCTYWNVDERQLCANDTQCPLYSIPGGSLDPECSRNSGDVCSFTCEYDYRPANQTTVTCTSSSTWDMSFSLLCEHIVCPSTIPNGYLTCNSNRNYNEQCNDFSCYTGYQPATYFPSLTCNHTGQWEWTDPSPLPFCVGEEELCPSNISGGWLSSGCLRNEGSICTYHCSECKNHTAPYYLACDQKTWDSNIDNLCTSCSTTMTTTTVPDTMTTTTVPGNTTTTTTLTSTRAPDTTTTTMGPDTTTAPVRCPSLLPGGKVYPSCDRALHSTCGFYCNYGCNKQLTLTSLRCNSYAEWINGSSACACATCPFYVPNGYISGSSYGLGLGLCDFKPGSTCDVKCKEGCDPRYSTSLCNAAGQWTDADYLCNCAELAETNIGTSDGGSISTVTIVMSVIGGIVFLIIVAFVIIACQRRRSQQSPYYKTTATNDTQGFGDNAQTNFANAIYIQ